MNLLTIALVVALVFLGLWALSVIAVSVLKVALLVAAIVAAVGLFNGERSVGR